MKALEYGNKHFSIFVNSLLLEINFYYLLTRFTFSIPVEGLTVDHYYSALVESNEV